MKWKQSLTTRWSEAGYLSRIVLTHAPRQASVSLIFRVRQNMKRGAIILPLAALILFGAFYGWRERSAGIYMSYPSPDGRFRVEVWRYPELYSAPGDSGGAPGFVRLVDSESGKTIHRKQTEMVMVIDTVRWSPTSVDIKLFTEWILPK